jgi:SAM-dependent methyltransferase
MGLPSASELLAWLASIPPRQRDGALEERLGIASAADADDTRPPGEHFLGYHPSGVAPIVHALVEAPVTSADVLVDLGSGLGKVVLLAALLTGAKARGVELQPHLVERARQAAARLGVDVRFDVVDARDAELGDGTVFFLYTPCTGPALGAIVDRLRAVAARRAIVVCALGLDLDREGWLARRDVDAFWLAIYDSVLPGLPARRRGESALTRSAEVDAIVREAFVAAPSQAG